MIYPASLNVGDKIAILSPASNIAPKLVEGACNVLKEWGFNPVIGKHCLGRQGTYSGNIEQRIGDLKSAFADPEIKAILCSRGGYGVVHLLEYLPASFLIENSKWVIGFSDITALHATMVNAGIVSVHAPMCKHLTERGSNDKCSLALKNILTGSLPNYVIDPHQLNRNGEATGTLVGGNMAVMCALASTHVDFLKKDTILFIEDISEAVYKIERLIYQLRLNGMLPNLKGLIVGQFTDYKPDKNGESMYQMIHRLTADYNFPIAFDFPVGHVDHNLPLIEGAAVTLSVTTPKVTLSFKK